MSEMILTPEQRQTLRSAHRRFKDKRSADRIKCIYLAGNGWQQSDICEALLLDAGTVRQNVTRYLEGGIEGLLETHFTGGKPKLTDQEMSALDQHLQESLYLDAKSIADYVQENFQKGYSVRGMTELLKRLNYVYKKPKVIPGKADPAAQKAFLEYYASLKKALQPSDKILFMDGVHPQHNTVAAYGWIKKGQDKAVKTNSGRQRLNINGALDIETCKATVTYEATLNALTILNLFTKLRKAYRKAGKIYLICDNAGYYKPDTVQKAAAALNIELVFLPPYSPNLNLIERFWKFFKKKVLYNRYYPKFSDFKEAVTEFFEDLKQYKSELKSLLTENFHLVEQT